MSAALPEYRVVTGTLRGAPYTVSAIYIGDQLVHSQLGRYGSGEVEQRVRAFVSPQTSRDAVPFSYGNMKRKAGRPRDDERGPARRDNDDAEVE